MATEERLIDANALKESIESMAYWSSYHPEDVMEYIDNAPTVDAVPIDAIRVDFRELFLAEQKAILNISICGKSNTVHIPFEREVVEVVHGRWIWIGGYRYTTVSQCSECLAKYDFQSPYCPNCGAKMDGERKDNGM